jgi:hypothetical protein
MWIEGVIGASELGPCDMAWLVDIRIATSIVLPSRLARKRHP